jgi:hypothetical protein
LEHSIGHLATDLFDHDALNGSNMLVCSPLAS